jgi:A/G-specific adenine glycosylase
VSPARPPSDERPAAGAPRLAGGRREAAPDGAPDLSPARLSALQERLLGWYAANGRDLPWRHTTDPYAILVSEVMLQQTQAPRVVARYPEFLTRFPTLASLADATLGDVLAAWLGLGYNNRALRLKRCAEALPGGRLPAELDALRALPGIGPYTARAVLVFAHNADLAAVDANVRRVLTSELGLAHDLPDAALQAVADAALPRGRSRDWHNALMDYGSLVLTSRSTGIAPRTRQTPFAGSPRQRRARLLCALIERGPLTRAEAAATLDLSAEACDAVIASLVRDGLAAADETTVAIGGP